jgi:hypothetical protein
VNENRSVPKRIDRQRHHGVANPPRAAYPDLPFT